VMAHFSHAYPDGCCIYFTMAGTGSPAAFERTSVQRYDSAWRDAIDAAIEAGATVAHHHGVGRSKARGMAREIPGAIGAMRALKRAFDPYGVLNPGVLAPLEDVEPAALVQHDKNIDEQSQIAWVDGDTVLRDAARALDARGLALVGDVEPTSERIADWLAKGARGAPDPFVDPVDHLVAGIEVALPHGRVIVPPVPRRATGPDFGALAVGAQHAFGAEVAGAWLRVAPKDTTVRGVAFAWDDRAPLNAGERALSGAVARELAIG
jgi:alkyldihydroxyacetonephosphate synthase